MQCDICFRTGGHKLPFLCATDARNQLYGARIQTARILLEKDSLEHELSELLPANPGVVRQGDHQPATATATQLAITSTLAERDQIIERTNQIIAHADELKAKVEQAKRERDKKRVANERRKSELASACNGIEARRAKQIHDIENSNRRTKYRWNQTYNLIAGSRTYLCYESAKLYGLRRVRDSNGNEDYRIGDISIVDLRSMNRVLPAQLSTSLSHVAHVLMLAAHYLAIRLPAEITLPHGDYPLPTIFSLPASYMHSNVPFPGGSPTSSNNSPSTSRHAEHTNQPRPRPLWTTKPLIKLAEEDPAAYALFIEGVVLLAYNIAWLCKCQSIPVGESTGFEDICNIGRNLWNLLIGDKPRLQPTPRSASLPNGTPKNLDQEGFAEGEEKPKRERPILGWASHGSAYSFLGSADGTEFVRGFKVPRPNQLVDRLKSQLMTEAANSEWEVVNHNAWAEEDELGDDGVVVGARKEGAGTVIKHQRDYTAGMQSFMSMRTVVDAVEIVGNEGAGNGQNLGNKVERRESAKDKKPGTNGWTKLKPRA